MPSVSLELLGLIALLVQESGGVVVLRDELHGRRYMLTVCSTDGRRIRSNGGRLHSREAAAIYGLVNDL